MKVYTIDKNPVFRNQHPSAGTGGYTHLAKELKSLGDSFQMQAHVPYYLAVYPEKGGVALTLKFTGGGATYMANIKQLKNKVFARNTPAAISPSPNLGNRLLPANFDADNGKPFINLP